MTTVPGRRATVEEDRLAPRLAEALADVEVAADRCAARVVDRELRAPHPRGLRAQLSQALYATWHTGRPPDPAPVAAGPSDHALAEALRAQVPHAHTWLPATLPADDAGTGATAQGDRDGDCDRDGSEEEPATWLADLAGVRVRVPVEALHPRRDRLRMPAVRPRLSPGFLTVDGPAGHGLEPRRPPLRVYLHLVDADAAVPVWGAVLAALADTGLPYRAKIISTRAGYPRRDAAVVYLSPECLPAVPAVVAAAAASGLGAAPELSPFVAPLAPGVGWAWEPSDPQAAGLSFGEHRCRAVAAGLCPDGPTGLAQSEADRHRAVAVALRAARVRPDQPHLNVDSPELAPGQPGRVPRAGSPAGVPHDPTEGGDQPWTRSA